MGHGKLTGLTQGIEGDPDISLIFILAGPILFMGFLIILSFIF